jgi:hypothetical protein
VIRKIEEVASDLCRRSVPEEKALKESAFELMRAMPTEQLADWVVRIAAFRWPWMYASSGSSGGSKNTQTRKVDETTRQPGRRTVSGAFIDEAGNVHPVRR